LLVYCIFNKFFELHQFIIYLLELYQVVFSKLVAGVVHVVQVDADQDGEDVRLNDGDAKLQYYDEHDEKQR